jgi:hypothetical protein
MVKINGDPIGAVFNNIRKIFLKETEEAQENLDMRQHCKDEEYNEVILEGYAELLPYKEKERASKIVR